MKDFLEKYSGWLLLAVLIIMFIPWLGESLYNTKGEPRESIVAVSMLNSGNWILPVSFDYEIPYKPPFLAWCIAAISWLLGGQVTEFTSRVPSALACIFMAMATYAFFKRYRGSRFSGVLTALILATSIEVWRAASSCRVDMLNTAFMVGAMYSMYSFFENKCRGGLPWLAILLMSCSFLTKGPVGVALPCLVLGIYRLMTGDRFLPLLGRLFAAGVFSCVIPAIWYIAAYKQGGDNFLSLVMEENFGRLTGSMSYESHENPWYYNVMTVVSGMAPYTLLCVFALFSARWRKPASSGWLRSLRRRISAQDRATLFAEVVAIVIFVFYCIPKSKRSVYLLPIYPMLAYFVALLVEWLIANRKKSLKVYGWVIAVVSLIATSAVAAAYMGVVPKLAGFAEYGCGIVVIASLAIVIAVACVLLQKLIKGSYKQVAAWTIATTVALLTSVSCAALPPILSSKSDYPVAMEIKEDYPDEILYSFVDDTALRLYEINFYLGDRLRIFDKEFERDNLPAEGLLLSNEEDEDALMGRFAEKISFEKIKSYTKPAPMMTRPKRLTTCLYKFSKK